MIVPPNNYTEAHFRPDGGKRQCPTQSLSDVTVHEPPGGAGPGGRGSGSAFQQASPGGRCRCLGHAWEAPGREILGCFSSARVFCIVFKNLQHLFISQQLIAFSSWDDSSAWSNILLNRACGKFPVTEPRVQLTLFQNSRGHNCLS